MVVQERLYSCAIKRGKGNANKELMYESFLKETSRNLQEELVVKSEKIGNPTSDIVDSYYICKMMLDSQE